MITVELFKRRSYYEKMGIDIDQLVSDVGDKLVDDYFEYINVPGRGTKGHRANPTGGAPKDTGDLIASHKVTKTSTEKTVTVGVDYATYVINGTSYQIPNDYPTRAYNKIIKNNISKTFQEIVKKYNLN